MATTAITAERENYLNQEYGIKSWLLTRDHKRIALLYLVSITFFFFIGGFFALLIRLELLTPAGDLVQADTYNKLFTMHGQVMDREAALRYSLREVVRTDAVEAYPDEPLRVVVYRMAEKGVTRMPVVERGTRTFLGLVSLNDLLKARTRHLEEESRRERTLKFQLYAFAYIQPRQHSNQLSFRIHDGQ